EGGNILLEADDVFRPDGEVVEVSGFELGGRLGVVGNYWHFHLVDEGPVFVEVVWVALPAVRDGSRVLVEDERAGADHVLADIEAVVRLFGDDDRLAAR